MSFTAKAQYAYEYQNTTVTTPTGVPVNALQFKYWVYNDFTSEEQALEDYQMTHNYNCEVISSSTKYYNCHGYAWHNVEGNMEQDKLRWINDIDYNSTPTYNVHRYYSTVHSNGKPSYFSFSISGPSTVCDQATYSIENLPSGATVEWSANNDNLELISGQGTGKAVFKKKGNWNDRIRAKIIIGNITRELEPYSVWVGPPHPISYIYGMTPGMNVYSGEEFTFMVNEGSPLLNYRWDIYNSTIIEGYYNSPKIRVKVDEQTYGSTVFSVGVSIWNSCGSVPEFRVERVIVNNQSFTLSPNLAGDMVTLQLMETDRKSGESILSTTRGMYEIQLWSGMRMLRSYKTNEPTFQIPVFGLPAGLYFVRVIKNGQAHIEKLMIKK